MGTVLWNLLLLCFLVVINLLFSYVRGKADARVAGVPSWIRPTLMAGVVFLSLLLAIVAVYLRSQSFHLMAMHGYDTAGIIMNSTASVLILLASGLYLIGSLYVLCKPAEDIIILGEAVCLTRLIGGFRGHFYRDID
jgi:hypothetical protein